MADANSRRLPTLRRRRRGGVRGTEVRGQEGSDINTEIDSNEGRVILHVSSFQDQVVRFDMYKAGR